MAGVVQVYSMVSVEDAVRVAAAGADHVGLMVSQWGLPYTVTPALGRSICKAVRGLARCVMLPITHSPETIVSWAFYVEPDLVQVASYESQMGYEEFARLSEELRGSGFRVIRVIPIGAGGELEAARRYKGVSDILMLDTHGEPPHPLLRGFIGGTGRTHDWSLSRRIRDSVRVPVILAGGLGPDNVAEAIRTVRPWGVDAATSLDLPGSMGRKDLARVISFIERAREAF